MKSLVAFLAGIGGAIGVAWLFEHKAEVRRATAGVERSARSAKKSVREFTHGASQLARVDLNACTKEDLVRTGLSEELADRVIENRPYRNKLDLVSRLVIPDDAYASIKHAIGVDDTKADEPVKVAS